MHAVRKGRYEVATLLLERGADVNVVDEHHGSLLNAVMHKDGKELAFLRLMVRYGYHDLDGCKRGVNAAYTRPLGEAIEKQSPEVVEGLLEAGADFTLKLKWKKDIYLRPLKLARKKGIMGCASVLEVGVRVGCVGCESVAQGCSIPV